MFPVTCQHIVVATDGGNCADGDCFLSNVEVAKAANLAHAVGFGRLFFKAPDEQHLMIELDQRLAIKAFEAGFLLLLALAR